MKRTPGAPGSIERRIGSGLLLSLLVAMTLLALLADYGASRLGDSFVTTRLQHDADSLIKALEQHPDGSLFLDLRHLPSVYQRVGSGHYFQVRGAAQQLRSRSLWEQTPALTPLPPGSSHSYKQRQGDEYWLVWSQGVQLHGQPLSLWLAEDIAPLQQQRRHSTLLLYGAMLLATALLLLVQRRLLRRSFDRIDAVRHAIQRLKQGEIEALGEAVPSEIRPLTEEINRLLVRLEQRISRSRSAMGNLAHELKRSLARLQLLQAALPPDVALEYQQILGEIRHLTERELQRARIAGTPHPGRRFAPATDLPDLGQVLQRIYPQVRFRLALASTGELPLDRDDMLELLGNLLDNAAKFGATEVRINLAESAAPGPAADPNQDKGIKTAAPSIRYCHLAVIDNGPGVPAAQCRRLTERGTRLDETPQGHGLGLSICQLIVEGYAGALRISPVDPHGLQVEVWLPLE